ncbi:MAG TPA: helix-turn-helix domain-containing protein [Acidimicrobiales bacterium]|nr:helix-turn-helix domain-containing protein [Acidimicrobiales bacterium]
MERLQVFKALGDNTRYAIYLEVARAGSPRSTSEIADALDLHANTVRPHLERMRDAGLLEVETSAQGQVGRPQHRWSLSPDAPSLGLEPSAFRLLARLVVEAAAHAGLDAESIVGVGREHGSSLPVPPRRPSHSSCVRAVEVAMAELGFDPVVGEDGGVTTMAFTRCPFREVAEAYPDVVCPLHRGIVEGVAGAAGGGRVARFSTLADRDPCQADLVPA